MFEDLDRFIRIALGQGFLAGADELHERFHFEVFHLVVNPLEELGVELIGGLAERLLKDIRCPLAFFVEQQHFLDCRESELLLDVVADDGCLVVRHQHLLLILRPDKAVVQFSYRQKLLGFDRVQVVELHIVAPAGEAFALFINREAFGEPSRNLMIRHLQRDDVHEFMPERAAPIERVRLARRG